MYRKRLSSPLLPRSSWELANASKPNQTPSVMDTRASAANRAKQSLDPATKPSRHSDDRALHATMPGNLHAPGLEPRPLAAVSH
jgi:hypothetical protein